MSITWFIHSLFREEPKPAKEEKFDYTNLTDHSEDSLKTYLLATGATAKLDLKKADRDLTLVNIVFSSSCKGKYRILKNGVAVCTLFTPQNDWNVWYEGDLELKKEDSLSFEFTNLDRCAADYYVGFDVKKNK
jgi:hypothetical protein